MIALGSLTGCGGTAGEAIAVDSSPIVIGDSAPAPEPATASRVTPAYDPRADLDIEDQSGNGRSVIIESVRVTRDNVFLVILNDAGSVLGSKPVPPGVQPVQIDLQRQVDTSGYLYGLLILDDGDGQLDPDTDLPLRDEDDEIIEEDFEYYLQ